jgi:hypothetical protein
MLKDQADVRVPVIEPGRVQRMAELQHPPHRRIRQRAVVRFLIRLAGEDRSGVLGFPLGRMNDEAHDTRSLAF